MFDEFPNVVTGSRYLRREFLHPSLEDGLVFAIPWIRLSYVLVAEARDERLHALQILLGSNIVIVLGVCIVGKRLQFQALDEVLDHSLQPTSLRQIHVFPAVGSQPAQLPCWNVNGESEDVLG